MLSQGCEEEQTHACRLLAILGQATPTHGKFKDLKASRPSWLPRTALYVHAPLDARCPHMLEVQLYSLAHAFICHI